MQRIQKCYQNIFNFLPDLVICFDKQDNLLFWNKAVKDVSGYSDKELASMKVTDLFNPKKQKEMRAFYQKIFEAGCGKKEIDYVTKEGRYILHELSGNIFKDFFGNVIIICMGRDITERKKIEDELREKNTQFRAILNQSFQFMGLLDPQGILLDVNKLALEFIGFEAKDVLNKPFWETPWWTHSKEQQDKLKDAIRKVAAGEKVIHFEATHIAKDGSLHYVDFLLRSVQDNDGKAVYLVPEGHDITEHKKIEDELREKNTKFQAILDQSFQFMGLLDLQGTLIEANKAALKFIGLEAKDVLNKPFWETPWWTHSKEQQDKLKDAIRKVAAGEKVIHFEATHIAKDGSLHYVDFLLRSVQDNDGKVVYLVPEGHDITLHKRYQQSLQENIKIKSDFTNMVSHELRTPLSVLKESLALILDGLVGKVNPEQKEMLEVAKKNVDRLSRLINEILSFQKLESGKMIFAKEENDINELLKEAGNTILPALQKKGLELIFTLDDQLPKLLFDRDKISEVLLNLLDNAVKFTEKGKITILSDRKNHSIHVAIQDTGIGIKKEHIEELFQEYKQLKRIPGGTGLGLVICKKIIDAHRGKIWVESVFGEGTTVHFCLPLNEKK